MGAKQSKRSVDISGKEAEGGGEVAAAGAGGEGRMEPLADADALKPQLNGDAHIQNEQTDKEKELDVGTPENEKDATTEKEAKEEDDKQKEAPVVTNGESESKVENGESAPTPEDAKKPKKEKVKKKWSLRSISFSRKDKPKQEKKQKDEEPKLNGETEKVPEETAEATPEAANEVAEEVKAPAEEKDEKTPETPVTEPLTNGTSTPDSVKVETPTEEAAPAPSPEAARPAEAAPASEPEPEPQPEPEQLPVNGLSLEESKPETPEIEKPEETKPEPPVAETAEIVPVPEIPKEVCVEQLPLLEPTPPPLPANPPPSSVASFAATTMAPELTDASLANTADAAIMPLSALPDTKDILVQPEPLTTATVTETLENELPSILKETCKELNANGTTIVADVNVEKLDVTPEIVNKAVTGENSESETPKTITETIIEVTPKTVNESIQGATVEVKTVPAETAEKVDEPTPVAIDVIEPVKSEPVVTEIVVVETETPKEIPVDIEAPEIKQEPTECTVIETANNEEVDNKVESLTPAITEPIVISEPELENIPEPDIDVSEGDDTSLPPPPPVLDEEECATNLDEVDEKLEESLKQIPEPIAEIKESANDSNHVVSTNEMTNGVHDVSPDEVIDTEMLKKKKAAVGCAAEVVGCNGVAEPAASADVPSPPAAELAAPAHTPQEPLPVSDKLADLIPEVPDVPELKTDTLQETVTDVAVAN